MNEVLVERRPPLLWVTINRPQARNAVDGVTAAQLAAAFREFDATREAAIRKLWDGKALNASYRKLRTQLEEWMARADKLELEAAARESYLMGSNAIRHVVYDPLLPAPLVDAEARHAFVETVRRYDSAGQEIWRRLGSISGSTGNSAATRSGSPSR